MKLNQRSTDSSNSVARQYWCYTLDMPTARPRHMLTETDDIARAVNDAALAWPELRGDRAALLRKLVEAGHASLAGRGGVREVVRGAAGAATGVYPRNARAELLAEWPE